MDVHGENARVQDEAEPKGGMDNIQWLRVKYREVLEREASLLEYLVKVLVDFDHRIMILESKSEEGARAQ